MDPYMLEKFGLLGGSPNWGSPGGGGSRSGPWYTGTGTGMPNGNGGYGGNGYSQEENAHHVKADKGMYRVDVYNVVGWVLWI